MSKGMETYKSKVTVLGDVCLYVFCETKSKFQSKKSIFQKLLLYNNLFKKTHQRKHLLQIFNLNLP